MEEIICGPLGNYWNTNWGTMRDYWENIGDYWGTIGGLLGEYWGTIEGLLTKRHLKNATKSNMYKHEYCKYLVLKKLWQ